MTEIALALIETGKSMPGFVLEDNGKTALHIACEEGLPDVAYALLRTGRAKPEHADSSGITALMKSIITLHRFENLSGRDLKKAPINEMTRFVMDFIQSGRSVPGHVAKDRITALILACRSTLPNVTAVALALIATGKSNPGQKDSAGRTARDYAIQNGLTELAEKISAEKHYTTPALNRDVLTTISEFTNGPLMRTRKGTKGKGRGKRSVCSKKHIRRK